MTATITLIYAGHVAEAIKSGDKNKIRQMISTKREALAEALELAEFNKGHNPEFADLEATRARRLQKEIKQLESSL